MRHRLYVHSSSSALVSTHGCIDEATITATMTPHGSLVVEYVTTDVEHPYYTIAAVNLGHTTQVTVNPGPRQWHIDVQQVQSEGAA